MPDAITCLHLADTHFGMENFGFTNPQTGLHTRLEDFSQSLGQVIDHALAHEVDLVLFAGDAYKRNSPSPTEQREFVKHFLRLADAGIPTVMIAGNHDIPVVAGKATSIHIFRDLRPPQFYVYNTQPTLEHPPIIDTRHGPIAVCCIPYISPSYLRQAMDTTDMSAEEMRTACQDWIQNLVEHMPRAVPEGIPKVLLAHLTVHRAQVGGYRGSPLFLDEIPILASTLAHAGYDYVALGHVHFHQNLSPREEVPVVYSGSIDRMDFGEADEKKGFVEARVSCGGAEFQFHEIKTRPLIHIEVNTEKGDDLTGRILEEIEREARRLKGAIARITYMADDDEVHTIDMKRIHQALSPVHFKAGFYRVPRTMTRQRRGLSLSREATLADALAAYLREHEEWKDEAAALVEKALEIEKAVRVKSEPGSPGEP